MRTFRTKHAATLLSALFFSLAISTCAFSQEGQKNTFLVLTIDNQIISPVIADYISKGIDRAQEQNYSGVILMLDTPGGLLESTRAIVKKIMNASVPVITYIAPSGSRAGSAGVFITLASHIAAMAPSTNIGAAHPIELGGQKARDGSLQKAIQELTETLRAQGTKKQDRETQRAARPAATAQENREISDSAMEDKILNDTIAWISTIAKNKNRNADWARQAVLESASATEKEALEKNIIDLVALDMEDLLGKLDNKILTINEKPLTLRTQDARIFYFNLTLRQQILSAIINPNIAYILMLVGFLGLFIEITHPGVVFPGIVGVISLIVAFYAFAVLPINFAGIALIVLGIILFIAEALTPATFGLLTLGGAVSMLLGSLMLVDSSFLAVRISLNIILPFVAGIAAIVIFLVTNVIRAHKKKVVTGPEALIGQTGTAETDIDAGQEGQVFVAGELWTALNQSGQAMKKGQKVKVLGVDKIKLIVSQYQP